MFILSICVGSHGTELTFFMQSMWFYILDYDQNCAASCWAIKLAADSSPKVTFTVGLAECGSARGRWWVIAFASLGAFLLGFDFLYFLNYLYLHPWVFLTFVLPTLSHPTGESNQTTRWEFSCWLGSTHHSVCQLKTSAFCFCKDARILMLHCSLKFIDLWSL